MKNLILTLTTLFFANTLNAATQFQFKPEMGKVEFKTKGWPNLVKIPGKGKGVSGQLTEHQGKVTGELVFDLTSLKTGIELRDTHMKDNYLQVTEHPTAKLSFKDMSIPADFDGSFKFKGLLTLHGEEKEISGEAEMDKDGKTITVKGEFPIKITDFKIPVPSYKGITVAEKVSVKFETKVNQL